MPGQKAHWGESAGGEKGRQRPTALPTQHLTTESRPGSEVTGWAAKAAWTSLLRV